MIRSSVTVSLVPEARGGPFVFWDDLPAACGRAAELGFDAVELFVPDADTVDARRLRRLLDDHGLAVAAVGTGAGWVKYGLSLTAEDPSARQRARHFVRSIVDFAGSFGAPAIIGSMQGRWTKRVDRQTALGYLTEALVELAEQARSYGVPLLFEPLNRYETNLVNTLEEGTQLLQSSGCQSVRLLADLFHMSIEERDLAEALKAAGRWVGHLHFVDSNRRPVGEGHLAFGPIVSALERIHYDGYASAEALPYPDPDTAAQTTIRAFRRLFGGRSEGR